MAHRRSVSPLPKRPPQKTPCHCGVCGGCSTRAAREVLYQEGLRDYYAQPATSRCYSSLAEPPTEGHRRYRRCNPGAGGEGKLSV